MIDIHIIIFAGCNNRGINILIKKQQVIDVLFPSEKDNSVCGSTKEKEPENKFEDGKRATPKDCNYQFASGMGPNLMILGEHKGSGIDFRFPSKKDNSIFELYNEEEPECKCEQGKKVSVVGRNISFASGMSPKLMILHEDKSSDIDFRLWGKEDIEVKN